MTTIWKLRAVWQGFPPALPTVSSNLQANIISKSSFEELLDKTRWLNGTQKEKVKKDLHQAPSPSNETTHGYCILVKVFFKNKSSLGWSLTRDLDGVVFWWKYFFNVLRIWISTKGVWIYINKNLNSIELSCFNRRVVCSGIISLSIQ